MIYLKNEQLIDKAEVKEVIDELTLLISDQYLNTNIMLQSNNYWIDMVRQEKAYNPSTEILGCSISFSKNIIKKKSIKHSSEETVDFLKEIGFWNQHKEECEKRFLESQNWIILLTLVSLYELWENVFRKRLINLINLTHKELKVLKKPNLLNSTFGDLRQIRHNYLHSNGYFKGNTQKLKVFSSYFHKGKKMEINEDDFDQIRRHILLVLQNFPNNFMLNEKKPSQTV